MARIKSNNSSESFKTKSIVVYTLVFLVLIFFMTVLQTTCLSLFGSTPALTFSVVCAIGFIFGRKAGAISGIYAGALMCILGGAGASLAPLLYTFCGYLCGAMVGWFLSKNLPSFIIYSAIAGILLEISTVIYYGLFSESFSLGQIITKVLIPEYFAFLVCAIPTYALTLGIYTLFKGKDKRKRRNFN